jgi:hypothetical protein
MKGEGRGTQEGVRGKDFHDDTDENNDLVERRAATSCALADLDACVESRNHDDRRRPSRRSTSFATRDAPLCQPHRLASSEKKKKKNGNAPLAASA